MRGLLFDLFIRPNSESGEVRDFKLPNLSAL